MVGTSLDGDLCSRRDGSPTFQLLHVVHVMSGGDFQHVLERQLAPLGMRRTVCKGFFRQRLQELNVPKARGNGHSQSPFHF